jgi:CHAT domain-containing protein/tetratricopeptide (TPR) repeat protein
MRFSSYVVISVCLMLAGCQTSGQKDGIPNILPLSAHKYYRSYQASRDLKAYVISRNTSSTEHVWNSWCSGDTSAIDALECAIDKCIQNKNNSQHAAHYTLDCEPFALGNTVVYGKSREEIAALAGRYEIRHEEILAARDNVSGTSEVKTLSVQEAMNVDVAFEKTDFVPPPRSIKDISAILDEQKLVDPQFTADLIEKAGAVAPKGASDYDLVKFFEERMVAGFTLGHMFKASEDAKSALKHFERIPADQNNGLPAGRVYKWNAKMELYFGNYKRAVEMLETQRGQLKMKNGVRVSLIDQMIDVQAQSGDLEGALATQEFSQKALAKWRRSDSAKNKLQAKRYEARWQASVLEMQGRWSEAEPYHRTQIEQHRLLDQVRTNPPHFLYEPYRGLVKNLRRQGRLLEAEVEARNALIGMLGIAGKFNIITVSFVDLLAQVLDAEGRHQDAVNLFRSGLGIVGELKVSEGTVFTQRMRFELGQALASMNDWSGAMAEFDLIKSALKATPDIFDLVVGRRVSLPLTLIMNDRTDEALTILEKSYAENKELLGVDHFETANTGGILGMAYAAIGRKVDALKAFQTSLPNLILESHQTDRQGSSGTVREKRLRMMLEAYLDLLIDVRGTALVRQAGISVGDESFRIADVIRGRSVQAALSASGARAAANSKELADVIRQLQDVERHFSVVSESLGNVLSVPTDQQDPKIVKSLRAKSAQLQAARRTLRAEISTKFPDYANLINPKPLTVNEVRTHLRANEVLISMFSSENKTYVWAMPKQGKVGFHVADLGRQDLSKRVTALRSALDPGAIASLGDIPDFDVVGAYDLYAKLLKPLESSWKKHPSLLIVADGALGQLPFSLLPGKSVRLQKDREVLFGRYKSVPWLSRSHSITMLPSVTSLKTLRKPRLASGPRRPFVGFGDPFFSKPQQMAALRTQNNLEIAALRSKPQTRSADNVTIENLPRLADTRAEIVRTAQALEADPARDIYLGEKASEDVVKTMDLTPYKIISFATHGLVPGDLNGLSQPALALSARSVTGGKEDGLLTMGEILGLRLNADWAVLSACNTASADGRGVEAVSGLGRAFFYAGARALLVSSWPVHSGATTQLMTTLFSLQAKNPTLSRSEALRQTRHHMIDKGVSRVDGKVAFSYAHPIFWAPFIIVGDGGGAKSVGN